MDEIRLRRLTLFNFKNYLELVLESHADVICFLGPNGSGKTNLLDAVHYLCNCKSYFNPMDAQNIAFGEQQMVISGVFERKGEQEEIVCALKRNQRKIFKRNHKEYERLIDHYGWLPCVMITPYDIDLIWEGSEIRRKFIDSTLSQFSRSYLDHLIAYNHALLQRNAVLKTYAGQVHFPEEFIELWDVKLIDHAAFIHEERKSFLTNFTAVFNQVYRRISGDAEQVSLRYMSELNEHSLEYLLKTNQQRDRRLERTGSGVHKDDLEFLIEGHPIKKFASQGQQKSFLFALKFTQYLFIRENLQLNPILMLDDFFDKIDALRVNNILDWLKENHVGQIFITDTSTTRVLELLRSRDIAFDAREIAGGKIVSVPK